MIRMYPYDNSVRTPAPDCCCCDAQRNAAVEGVAAVALVVPLVVPHSLFDQQVSCCCVEGPHGAHIKWQMLAQVPCFSRVSYPVSAARHHCRRRGNESRTAFPACTSRGQFSTEGGPARILTSETQSRHSRDTSETQSRIWVEQYLMCFSF